MTIGDRLRRERTRAGLSQQDMARVLGIGRGHVWKVENGVASPSKALIERWSHATGAAHADLVLEGPALFDLAFAVDATISDPFAARRVLDMIDPSSRRQVAVWPASGDASLRLRVRGSALPHTIDLAGVDVQGIGVLGSPVVTPVRAADELVAWIRAADERDAMAQIDARMAVVAAHGRVSISTMGRVFVARVANLSERASLELQELVEESPIGLFVPSMA